MTQRRQVLLLIATGCSCALFGGRTRASETAAAGAPEYVICMNCEKAMYLFEWQDGRLTEVTCEDCGNDDPEQFVRPEDYDSVCEKASAVWC